MNRSENENKEPSFSQIVIKKPFKEDLSSARSVLSGFKMQTDNSLSKLFVVAACGFYPLRYIVQFLFHTRADLESACKLTVNKNSYMEKLKKVFLMLKYVLKAW